MLTDLVIDLLLELLLCFSFLSFVLGDLCRQLGEASCIKVRDGLLFGASEETCMPSSVVDLTAASK